MARVTARVIAMKIAMPPIRGVDELCTLRSFGWSSRPMDRAIGINMMHSTMVSPAVAKPIAHGSNAMMIYPLRRLFIYYTDNPPGFRIYMISLIFSIYIALGQVIVYRFRNYS